MPGLIPKNLSSFLEESSKVFAKKTAIQIKRNGRYDIFTYRDLYEKTRQLAQGLHELGIHKGDRVVLLSENSPEWVIAYFAIVTLGAVVVPVDPKLSESEWMVLLQHSEPFAIFSLSPFMKFCLQNQINLAFVHCFIQFDDKADKDGGEKLFFFKNLLKHNIDLPSETIQPGDLAVLIYTSGTTGNPKGVMLSHGNLVYYPFLMANYSPFIESDRILMFLPFHHIYPINSLLAGLASGASMTILLSLKPSEIFSALQENKITAIVGVPRLYEFFYNGVLEKVLQQSKFSQNLFHKARRSSQLLQKIFGATLSKTIFKRIQDEFGSHIRILTNGGASLKPEIFNFFKDLGFLVQEGYGLTETCGCVVLNPQKRTKVGTAGMVLSDSYVKIDNPQADGVGEIVVAGPSVFKGYYKDDQTSAETLQDGWMHTGDLGRFDEYGYLYITGRKKDVIVLSSGKNVYPDEVEALYGHSDLIKQIGVIGMNRGQSEEVFACIVPNIGSFSPEQRQNREAIESRIREHLMEISKTVSPHKRIMGYKLFYKQLPSTSLNKIKKHELRAMVEKDVVPSQTKSGDVSEDHSCEGEIRNFIAKLLHISPGSIGLDSHLTLDLAMDSLAKVELAAWLKKKYAASISEAETGSLESIRDVLTLLHAQIKGSSGKEGMDHHDDLNVDMVDTTSYWKNILMPSEEQKKLLAVFHNDGPAARVVRWCFRKFNALFHKFYLSLDVKGLENISDDGVFVLSANHSSHLDTTAILAASGLQNFVILAAQDYFFKHPRKGKAFKLLFNAVPFDRHANFIESLKVCKIYCDLGKNLILFPEGTRSLDGKLQPFKVGVGVIALELNIPIIPVYIDGTYHSLPKGKIIPKPGRISVFFGQPLKMDKFAAYRGIHSNYQIYKMISDELRRRILSLKIS